MKHDLKKVFLAAILVVSFGAGSFVAKAEEGNIASVQQTKGRIVTGVITDATDGSPIVGANVMLENSKTGVITDLDGKYSIRVNNNRDVLIITYIGYKKREVPVEDLGVINIQLHSDNELLDEVVVVGQGTQKKVSVTGSISAIKGAELRTTSSSLSNGMAGKLAGVINLTKYIATQLGKKNIRCNAVAPGLILTPAALDNLNEDVRNIFLGQCATPYLGEPEDVAATIAFLASNDARYITGQTIVVDGGLTTHNPTVELS